MAEGAANVLIDKLGASLCEGLKLCRDVDREAHNLKDDVETLPSLRAADRSNDDDETSKASAKRAREAVYDADDVLDKYKLRLEVNHGPGFLGFLRRTYRGFKQLKSRCQIASEIQDIRAKILEIPVERRDNQLSGMKRGLGWNSLNNNRASDPRLDVLFVEESELVGIDVPRNLPIQRLSFGEQKLITIAVEGMGGLVKTTLVKKVNKRAKRGDPSKLETYAWIPVSKTFQPTDVHRKMIAQFYKAKREQAPPGVDAMTERELVETILEYLDNKRFLLVLDDVWSIEARKSLKRALPDREYGSKVTLTTRSTDVAEFCRARPSDLVFNIYPLDREEAWTLFCRKAFRSEEEKCCPTGMRKLAQSFAKKCCGLPLAIVSLGRLLAVKPQTQSEMIHRSLGSELETDDHLKSMKSILLLSLKHLPKHLRSCFLFLSFFSGDYPIKRMKLIRLWIAEGLIESRPGRSLEEVADGYLNQLIRISLVQVVKWKHDETVKTCQIHDIVRDIIISKYKKGDAIGRYDKFTHLRSLLIFGVDGVISLFAKLRCLRVVDLENVPMESFPDDLTQLPLLRYLSLENTKIKNLPNSVEKLKRLETLNLKGTSVCELPAGILKLQRLRHLLVYRYDHYLSLNPFTCISGVKVPAAFGRLRSLRKVGLIEAETGVVVELGNLTELRRLCVSKLRRADGNDFCASVAKMSRLQALDVISIGEDEALELHSLSRPPPTLQRVYLSGRLDNLPEWIPSLHTLVSLRLCWSRLRDDPLKPLKSLANLVELDIIEAYDGPDVCFEGGGYPKLKLLFLEMRGLKQVRVENGAMPSLEILTVSHCEKLVEVALWLQQLTNMKELCVRRMPEEFVRSLYKEGRAGGEWADCVRHIPSIKLE